MWTQFMDMHSGGSSKEKWQYIYIEAPIDVAEIVFYKRFGHNPYRVTCSCCGDDYSVSDYDTLEEATSYNRNDYDSKWNDKEVIPIEQYILDENVHIIYDKDIKPEERVGKLPEQGYVWVE